MKINLPVTYIDICHLQLNLFPVDDVSKEYKKPSRIQKSRKAKRARHLIADMVCHLVFMWALGSLSYIYQDSQMYNSHVAINNTFFNTFETKVLMSNQVLALYWHCH